MYNEVHSFSHTPFRQARQVRKEYEERLMKANSLYQELDECMRQLRMREEEIKRSVII